MSNERKQWPRVPSKFSQNQVVRHRKGGLYTIHFIPCAEDTCDSLGTFQEETGEPVYVYEAHVDSTMWVRRQSEFEDGRFTLVEDE